MASPPVDKTSDKPRRKRRWLQFGLGTMLGLVTVLCLVLGLWVQRAERQRRAVEAIRAAGGGVRYSDDPSRVPAWLAQQLDEDYFRTVTWASLSRSRLAGGEVVLVKALPGLQRLYLNNPHVGDADLRRLTGLTELRWLLLRNTRITDGGLEHLQGLQSLEYLDLTNTQVSEAGLQHLKSLSHLEWLRLNDTSVSEAACERFERTCPRCICLPVHGDRLVRARQVRESIERTKKDRGPTDPGGAID
jgi:hypothetical protein